MPDHAFAQFNVEQTHAIIAWAQHIQSSTDSPFTQAQQLATQLGAHLNADNATIFGFWTPELEQQSIVSDAIHLEIFRPLDVIQFDQPEQIISFTVCQVPVIRAGEYTWAVVDGLRAGTKEQAGDFYWLVYQGRNKRYQVIHDHLAYSVPFGAFAPAELYDIKQLLAQRTDLAYFQKRPTDHRTRVVPPTNILQVHIATATAQKTIDGLTDLYTSPSESDHQSFIGYDALQLMPIAPTIEYEVGQGFWWVREQDESTLSVKLHKPDTTNWGYDSVVTASSAINPALLSSGRPDEFLRLVETLHQIQDSPMQLIIELVYGHIDNQALPLLNKEYFAGANQYGQNVNYHHPIVRANLLAMMHRICQYGIDGICVDGAQNFQWWDPETDTLHHDDEFLALIQDLTITIADQPYHPWVFFDEPTDQQITHDWHTHAFTTPNEAPYFKNFWLNHAWQIRDIAHHGTRTITGYVHHDNLRWGTQMPINSIINPSLGDTLPSIIATAFDNPAMKLLEYAFLPGIPRDFIHATSRAPWGFVRNSDDRYAIKIVSEEARWLSWRVNPIDYANSVHFNHLKSLGFTEFTSLQRFLKVLHHTVHATDYYPDAIVKLMQQITPALSTLPITIKMLKAFARAYMDDVFDYMNLIHHPTKPLAAEQNLSQLRQFRRARPWLQQTLQANDLLDYQHINNQSVVYFGMRHAPNQRETIYIVAHLEGSPAQISLRDWFKQDGLSVSITTHGLSMASIDAPLTLTQGEGIVLLQGQEHH